MAQTAKYAIFLRGGPPLKTIFVFTCLFVAQVAAFAQITPCKAGNPQKFREEVAREIASMRMSIYVISTFGLKGDDVSQNLQLIAKETVLAISKQLSLYADRFQNCGALTQKDYNEKLQEVILFDIALRQTASDEQYAIATSAEHWPLRDIMPDNGHWVINPDIRGNALPTGEDIGKILRSYAKPEAVIDYTSPTEAVARELLGTAETWDVTMFKPLPDTELPTINPQSDLGKLDFMSGKVKEFRSVSIKERIAMLAKFYVFK